MDLETKARTLPLAEKRLEELGQNLTSKVSNHQELISASSKRSDAPDAYASTQIMINGALVTQQAFSEQSGLVIEMRAAKPTNIVEVGAIVVYQVEGEEPQEAYISDHSWQGEIPEGMRPTLNPKSPRGKAMAGHKAGAMTEFQAPIGRLRINVIDVS